MKVSTVCLIPARKGSKRIYNKNIMNFFGKPLIYYSIIAARKSKLFDKIIISTDCNHIKKISEKELLRKFQKFDKKIQIKYPVFKDLRQKGYVIKTALKFGADFRIYPKGAKPGKKHAKWIVFIDHESKKLTWHEFSAKNRVAHSTKKNLLLAIVDEEGDITYYEVSWLKP